MKTAEHMTKWSRWADAFHEGCGRCCASGREPFFLESRRARDLKGLTLLEMVLSMSIMAIVFAVLVPQFRNIRIGWDSRAGAAEAMQNGRVLMDHIERNLAKAVRITEVSDSSEVGGYIEFEDNDGGRGRYQISGTYVQYATIDGAADLAGPVTSLMFTCYDACDLDTPILDVNSIRFVEVQATFTNSAELGRDNVLKTSAYLRTNGNNGEDASNALVAWWKFDEGAGAQAFDSSGNGYDGTLEKGAGFGGGKIGGAASLDGTNDRVSAGQFDVEGGNAHITIAAWVKADSFSSSREAVVVSKATGPASSHYYWMLGFEGDPGMPIFRLKAGGTTTDLHSAVGGYSTGVWTHTAATWDGSWMRLYKDGSLISFGPKSGDLDTNGSVEVAIGNQPGGAGSRPFDGMIDDLRIYNTALTQEQIQMLVSLQEPEVDGQGSLEIRP